MKEKGRKVAIWSVVVLWMIVIFKLSSQSGEQSNDLSLGVTGLIAALIEKISPSSDALAFNHIIRKCAHFFAYLVLGMVVLFAMRKMGVSGTKGEYCKCIEPPVRRNEPLNARNRASYCEQESRPTIFIYRTNLLYNEVACLRA